jgi:hypothetical protein
VSLTSRDAPPRRWQLGITGDGCMACHGLGVVYDDFEGDVVSCPTCDPPRWI